MAKKQSTKSWVESEFAPVAGGRAVQEDVNNLLPEDLCTAYGILNRLEKVIEDRKKLIKPPLLAMVKHSGEAVAKDGQKTGSFKMDFDGHKLQAQRRVASREPDREKLMALLAKREIDVTDVYDEVKVLEYNPSKVDYLVELGKLSKEEVEVLKGERFALVFSPSPTLKKMMERAEAPEEKAAPRKPRAVKKAS
jgi:hypothetical protein